MCCFKPGSIGAKSSSYIHVKKFDADALRKAVASQTHFQLDKSIRAFF